MLSTIGAGLSKRRPATLAARVVVGVTHQKAEVVETPEAAATAEALPAEPEVIARGKKPEEEPAE